MRAALGLCLAALALAGCGQKGPLYLPDQKHQGRGDGGGAARDTDAARRRSSRPTPTIRRSPRRG